MGWWGKFAIVFVGAMAIKTALMMLGASNDGSTASVALGWASILMVDQWHRGSRKGEKA